MARVGGLPREEDAVSGASTASFFNETHPPVFANNRRRRFGIMAAILLIDDNRVVRETLQTLVSEQHQCHTADRAEQAMELLEFQNYDLVITDISMPGLGGLEVLRHIKRRHAIPVIVISGRPDLYEDAAVRTGAFAFFSKPFRIEELETAVSGALATRVAKHQ